MLYFLHSTSVLSFYIDVVLTLSTEDIHPVPEFPHSVHYPHTHGVVVFDLNSIWYTWQDAKTYRQQPEACVQCSELTTSSKIGGSSRADEGLKWKDCPWLLDQVFVLSGCGMTSPTYTPPLMWPTIVMLGLQNFADASLGHTSLRINLSRQSYNTHQYLLYQIMQHDALKEW